MLRATEDGFMAGGFVQATHAPEVKYAQDSMELLYLWIGKDDTCFIQQQGFNFSPNYQFNITDMGVDGYQLDWSEKQEHFNVWDYQNIVNLTAIVGENGTGKTTLLRYLTAAPQMLNKKNSDDQLVQIYRIGNSIKIFCKLDKVLRFDAERKCSDMHVSVVNQGEADKLLHQQTVVLMSNAKANAFFRERPGKNKTIIFSPEINSARGKAFYRKVSGWTPDKPEDFKNLQDKIIAERSTRDFEQYIGIGYDLQVLSGRFIETNIREIVIGVANPIRWFEILGQEKAGDHERKRESFQTLLLEYFECLRKKASKDILSVLWDSLCFEVLSLVEDKAQVLADPELFSAIRKAPVQYLQDHINVIHEGVIEYYRRAQSEIIDLGKILSKCVCGDRAYFDQWNNAARTVVLERGSKQYRAFCKFVDKQMKMPASFVLKHLIVRISPQSSGEWAIQNMFSWLRLPPYFRKVLGERSTVIRGNMLLMLDEVDLYMHPEWQRQFLKLLSDGLNREYRNKHIQVIITTHSPLVLSDIPRENVVYLKRDGNKCKIVDGPDMEETFGANIFSLLKDSFFLSKTMGEFAHTRIEKVIGDLEKLKESPQDLKLKKECRQLIEHIGEPIIRKKLMMMYDEAVGSDPAYLDRQSLERFSRLLESRDPEVGRQVRELVRRYLTENEPG